MTDCTPCAERRRKFMDALLHARIADAAKQAALGAAEMVGIKEKEDGDDEKFRGRGRGMGEGVGKPS